MTPEQFVFWLSGFLTATNVSEESGLLADEVVIINGALKTVKTHSELPYTTIRM